jgi:hypothetical protein
MQECVRWGGSCEPLARSCAPRRSSLFGGARMSVEVAQGGQVLCNQEQCKSVTMLLHFAPLPAGRVSPSSPQRRAALSSDSCRRRRGGREGGEHFLVLGKWRDPGAKQTPVEVSRDPFRTVYIRRGPLTLTCVYPLSNGGGHKPMRRGRGEKTQGGTLGRVARHAGTRCVTAADSSRRS